MSKDHYQILGLPRSATTSEIKAQFKLLAKKYHPDLVGENDHMTAINAAYRELIDPKKRFAYDRSLELEDFDELTARTGAAPRRAPSTYTPPRKSYPSATIFATPEKRRKFSIFAFAAYGALSLIVILFVIAGIVAASKSSSVTTTALASAQNGFPGVGQSAGSNPQAVCETTKRQAQIQITQIQNSIATIKAKLDNLNKYEKGSTPDMVVAQRKLLQNQLTTYQTQLTTLQNSTNC